MANMDNIDITKFSVLPLEHINAMQFDSGLIVDRFDPEKPAAPKAENIVCATTGDISVTCSTDLVDLGDDVNNIHLKLANLQYISSRTCQMTFTALNITAKTLALALGAADYVAEDHSVVPRMNLSVAKDFNGIWWVGLRIDGGIVAFCIDSAFSTGGLNFSSSKDGKGNLQITLEGFVQAASVAAGEGYVPIEMYVFDPESLSSD